jgi:DNA repair protein RadD
MDRWDKNLLWEFSGILFLVSKPKNGIDSSTRKTFREKGVLVFLSKNPQIFIFIMFSQTFPPLPKFQPYWYQQDAIDAVLKVFSQGVRRTLIVAPTGSGKSVIAACFCEQVISTWGRVRILVVSSFEEILKQDHVAIQRQMPESDIGLYSASCGSKTIDQITVAGIQSVFRKPQLFEEFDIIIVDEAHLVSFELNTMYRKFLDVLDKPTLGLTATHFRLKGGYLHKGPNAFFQSVAYEITIPVLQREGKLCEIIGQGSKIKLDASKIRVSAGDYVTKDLSLEFDRAEITRRIARDLLQHKETRRKWLGFAIDIKHAKNIAVELNALGVKTTAIHSKLQKAVKNQLIEDFKAGVYQCAVSVAMLTTGFDVPAIDFIFCIRHTKSVTLLIQMIGRGMRTCMGKPDCLFKDYTKSLRNLGPIDDPQVPEPGKKKKKGEPVLKECEECFLIVPVSVRICPRCETPFKIRHKLSTSASKAEIISKAEWFSVDETVYSVQISRKGNIPMLKATYKCGLRWFHEYVLFDHTGYALAKARRWWEIRSLDHAREPPADSHEALKRSWMFLKRPAEIYVNESGKYPKIKDYRFE